MFIFTSVITFPIALMGYILWPGTPLKPNKLFLTNEDIAVARARLQRHGHGDNHGILGNPDLNWPQIKKTFSTGGSGS